jgi:DNA replication protein DnaC
VARIVSDARFPAAKIRELSEGGYIERAEPVVLMGECGTGKTHLATGLCVAARLYYCGCFIEGSGFDRG